MIQGITGGQGIIISGSNGNGPYVDLSRPSAGMLRYGGINFEVYDGSTWQTISHGYPMVELTPDVHELLQWAKIKRDEEYTLRELVNKYPVLSDSHDQLLKAKEQFKMLSILVQNQEKHNATR